jgi:hypothetical protein
MEMSFWVPELLHNTEIDEINFVIMFTNTHQKISRLDVTMNKLTQVNMLYTGDLSDSRLQCSVTQ